MANNYFGANERIILSTIKDMDVDGRGVRRDRLVSMAKYSSGKSRETLYKTLRNMVDKGLLALDPTSDKVTIPDKWVQMLKAGKCHLDLQPQQILPFEKRVEILYKSVKNVTLTEAQAVALFFMLDLNKEAIEAFNLMNQQDSEKKKRNKDFDDLTDLYFNRKSN